MKRYVLLICTVLTLLSYKASGYRTILTENETNETFNAFIADLPDYRTIASGSKIVVEYEGEWPEEMKGAFEYAAKIWEENLPMTLPIRIRAVLDGKMIGRNTTSTVTNKATDVIGRLTEEYSPLTSAIKAACFQDYHHIKNSGYYRFSSDPDVMEFLLSEDMTITYNSAMLSEFSFNLDAVPENKYDFVSLALRDIALGLGFGHSISAVNSEQRIEYSESKPTLYESIIMDVIGRDPYEAYKNATRGTLNIGYLTLYAPDPFQNGKSLRYIVSSVESGFNKIMSPDLCKGVAVRDISGVNYELLFRNLFDWDWLVWTGTTNSVNEDGNTEESLPYKGAFNYSFDSEDSFNEIKKEEARRYILSLDEEADKSTVYTSIESVCKPYGLDLEFAGGNNWFGIPHYVLSAQLKDGTWDALYSQATYGSFEQEGFYVDMSSLEHHFDENEYARSTSGGLKYRLVEITPSFNPNPNARESFRVKYFTRDFTPQTPVIRYSQIHEPSSPVKSQSYNTDYDDYYVDVEIGISGLEGVKRIMVDQYDGDDTMGFFYDVYDFRKGYFVANLDRELSTKLRIFVYNDNGSRISNTITIPPIGWPDLEPSFSYKKDAVKIERISSHLIDKGYITYEINNIVNMSDAGQGTLQSDRTIDLSSIEEGIYAIRVKNKGELIGISKFAR